MTTNSKDPNDSPKASSATQSCDQTSPEDLTQSRAKHGEPVYRVSFWTPRTSLITLILILMLIIGKHALPLYEWRVGSLDHLCPPERSDEVAR